MYLNEFLSKETNPGGVLGGTLFYIAACYKGLGNIDEAKKYYHRIIKELPNTKWEKNAKKALAKL
jgi:TolA-binding protein